MIVVDSSVLVMYFSREPGWRRARELLLEPVVTLDLAVKEVANALWKKVLKGELPLEAAARVVEDLASGRALPLYRQEPLVVRSLEIAARLRVTVYDALFIALAERLHASLATADERQAHAARRLGVETLLLAGAPG
ncbi:MAG: type II toxin-antitoxin system VapC family toxin [Crenarchaeota archaeon]|nr:type II toxin-antitoxin system VapC family toxin [Thermoproteota archaeon]